MEENTQLPKEDNNIPLTVEIVDLIIDMLSADASRARMEKEILKLLNKAAYATKRHQVLQVAIQSDKERKEANDQLREAKKLLNEVFRKHEAGLLPDRFIYENIKTFLYGE